MRFQDADEAPIFSRPYGTLKLLCGNTDGRMGTKTMDLKIITVRGGESTSHHYHLERLSIFHFISGEGLMISDHTETQRLVQAGTTVIVEPGEDHLITNTCDHDLIFIESEGPSHSSSDKISFSDLLGVEIPERGTGRFWNDSIYPRIKICGIKNLDSMIECVRLGVDAIGIHAIGPQGVRNALGYARWLSFTPPGLSVFLLLDSARVHSIANLLQRIRCDTIQLQGQHSIERIKEISNLLQGAGVCFVRTVSAAVGRGFEEVQEEILGISAYVDAVLLDNGLYGGTGQTHDWSVSSRIVASNELPVIVAGGLNQSNLPSLFRRMRPYGIDIESGAEKKVMAEDGSEATAKDFAATENLVSLVKECAK